MVVAYKGMNNILQKVSTEESGGLPGTLISFRNLSPGVSPWLWMSLKSQKSGSSSLAWSLLLADTHELAGVHTHPRRQESAS